MYLANESARPVLRVSNVNGSSLVPETTPIGRAERLLSFAREIDAIKERMLAKVGEEDLAYVKKLDRLSRAAELVGRTLIHFSFEPLGFGIGVGALWLHKQLEATEIGHTALHGAYDRLPGAEKFHSKRYVW